MTRPARHRLICLHWFIWGAVILLVLEPRTSAQEPSLKAKTSAKTSAKPKPKPKTEAKSKSKSRSKAKDPAYWEEAILAFEEQDRISPPKPGEVLFIGSSSIRAWGTLAEDMAPLPVINRGFGGSKIPDVIHYIDRIVLPYKPKMVVLYAGDNDMSFGKIYTPWQVRQNFRRFCRRLRAKLPKVKVYFLSIKPSRARWKRWPQMRRANRLIKRYCKTSRSLKYIDVSTPMLSTYHRPRKDLFRDDRLHMNADGYAIWTAVVKPILTKDFRN